MKSSLARKIDTKETEALSNAGDALLLKGKTLCIVSDTRFRSDLLAFFLQQKAGALCKCVPKPGDISSVGNRKGEPPDMLILDCTDLESEDVSALLSRIESTLTAKSLVCLFGVTRDQNIEVTALKLGVRGFFYQQDPTEHILAGLNAVLLGQVWISSNVLTQSMLKATQRNSADQKDSDQVLLTPREIEILRAIGIGASNSEIAKKLFISPHTVKTHVYNAFKKINITNRFQAAIWAAENL
jgi:DNA-binding NarL/FixJ family response regulator